MQEFSSISVSQYEAGSLAGQLTEQSRDGWSVVSIVSTGSTVTAYLSREATSDAEAPAVVTAPEPAAEPAIEMVPEPAAEPAIEMVPEPAAEPAIEMMPDTTPDVASAMPDITPEPVAEAAGWAASSDITPTPAEPTLPSSTAAITPEPAAAEPAPEPAAEPAVEPVAAEPAVEASAAGGAPAGWYADPSSRFELRYWDGGQWTEHVSRAGQQYTDPPVA
jgi:hypothetical protein